MKRLIVVTLLALSTVAYAQQAPKKEVLTTEERIQVLTTQLSVCRSQVNLQDLNGAVKALVDKIEASHPDYTLNLQTGQLIKK